MIKVLIVDDSALVRKLLSEELEKEKGIEVVGTAINPYVAREKIVELEPDVLTLDLEMPRMDGLSFLSKLMKHHPMPVVVVSSLTPKNSENALSALRLGAVDVICKPGSAYSTQNISQEIVKAVKAASIAKFDKNLELGDQTQSRSIPKVRLNRTTKKIIAIGSSTGGTKALEAILPRLPANMPGLVIVQHMPPVFTQSFSERLNTICKIDVKEAEDRDLIRPGQALIAPGNHHMLVEKRGAKYYTKIKQGPPVHHHRPSVDVLFNSVAKAAGINSTGVILTGMGSDGGKGLRAMKEKGAHTMAQDEETSVVFGMPKVAQEMGAVAEVLPLDKIAEAIVNDIKEKAEQPARS
ncbi:chemotaxis response regulator protein-glutamate methylesterase [Aliifodinibius sp. S!AR15-10]|uniref:protein-glutamate methylesterase/protein-glutamine glutaminase n=1 Tax=Aliifodinibius sp. S!AR15-10 TaxID=2950437 RepID=UPI0028620C3F|nr:chemotaxis response regulator protein-glutamate methylesterase [Aliifodinibius sp. S!AR15-10]MDR8392853.1 chemotaxis response regulator protein-glutamate methylesterase [Aliifodinibius sp. S!AR15-10]